MTASSTHSELRPQAFLLEDTMTTKSLIEPKRGAETRRARTAAEAEKAEARREQRRAARALRAMAAGYVPANAPVSPAPMAA